MGDSSARVCLCLTGCGMGQEGSCFSSLCPHYCWFSLSLSPVVSHCCLTYTHYTTVLVFLTASSAHMHIWLLPFLLSSFTPMFPLIRNQKQTAVTDVWQLSFSCVSRVSLTRTHYDKVTTSKNRLHVHLHEKSPNQTGSVNRSHSVCSACLIRGNLWQCSGRNYKETQSLTYQRLKKVCKKLECHTIINIWATSMDI